MIYNEDLALFQTAFFQQILLSGAEVYEDLEAVVVGNMLHRHRFELSYEDGFQFDIASRDRLTKHGFARDAVRIYMGNYCDRIGIFYGFGGIRDLLCETH